MSVDLAVVLQCKNCKNEVVGKNETVVRLCDVHRVKVK